MKPFYWQENEVEASGLATIIDTVRKYESRGIEMRFRKERTLDEGEREDIMKMMGYILGTICREHLGEGQEYLRSCITVGDSGTEERNGSFVLTQENLKEISFTYLDSNSTAEIFWKYEFVGLNVWYKAAGDERELPLINIDAKDVGYLVKYDNLRWWKDVSSVSQEQLDRAGVMQGELKYAIETALGLEPDFLDSENS